MAQPALWTTRHRIQVDNVTIAYQTIGDGPPLVLIHGLAGSASWWRHNIADLATHFRLYLIDLIGFGASRGRQCFMLTRAASQIATWMRLVGIPRASLIGHSMGGLIAADLAAAWPEQTDRMILVNAATLPLNQAYIRYICGFIGLIPSLRLGFLPVLAADLWRAGPITMFYAIRQLLAADITARITTIQAPTLLIWGARDTLVPLYVRSVLHKQLSNSRLIIIPQAGHNPMWECPIAFNRQC